MTREQAADVFERLGVTWGQALADFRAGVFAIEGWTAIGDDCRRYRDGDLDDDEFDAYWKAVGVFRAEWSRLISQINPGPVAAREVKP